jgi:hypothetical protein
MVESRFEYNMRKLIYEDLPISLMEFVAQLPVVGTPALKNAASKLKKMSVKINGMLHVFEFFMKGDWRYENQNIYKLIDRLSPEEKLEFHCDAQAFEWAPYLEDYLKGMVIFVLKEDKIAPEFKMKQILMKQYSHLDQVRDVMRY